MCVKGGAETPDTNYCLTNKMCFNIKFKKKNVRCFCPTLCACTFVYMCASLFTKYTLIYFDPQQKCPSLHKQTVFCFFFFFFFS